MEMIKQKIIKKYNLTIEQVEHLFFMMKNQGVKVIIRTLVLSKIFDEERYVVTNDKYDIKLIYNEQKDIQVICYFSENYEYTRPIQSPQTTWSMLLKDFILCCVDLTLGYYESEEVIQNAITDEEFEKISIEEKLKYLFTKRSEALVELEHEIYYGYKINYNNYLIPTDIRDEILRSLILLAEGKIERRVFI